MNTKFLKKNKNRIILFIFLIITGLSIFVHFQNFSNLVGFSIDPPAHLTAVRDMVNSGKIGLVGPNITSKEVMGRQLFLGPFYYYVLAILGILSHWNVVSITGFFTSIWILTFIIIFFWLYKKFGGLIALLLYTLLSFYPLFILISRQIWNPQFIPLFGTLFLIYLIAGKRKINYFLAGLFWGLGLNVHYSTFLWAFIAAFFIGFEVYKKRFQLKNWLILLSGVILAELPLIIFEFRHNFYNLNTLIFQFRYGRLSAGYTFDIWYYYVLPFLPLAVFLASKIFFKIRKSYIFPPAVIILAALSIYFVVTAFGPEGQKPLYSYGWNISKQKEVAGLIIKDGEKNFEVAETISSDTRAMDIRWWLADSGVNVMDVVSYDKARVLYLVTTRGRPPENESVWEVSTLSPFEIAFKIDLGNGLFLYKLMKI